MLGLDQGARDPQAEAGAAVLAAGGEERLEDAGPVALGDAAAVVPEGDPGGSPGRLEMHLDGAGPGLPRVLDQVRGNDLETLGGDAGFEPLHARPRDGEPGAAVTPRQPVDGSGDVDGSFGPGHVLSVSQLDQPADQQAQPVRICND